MIPKINCSITVTYCMAVNKRKTPQPWYKGIYFKKRARILKFTWTTIHAEFKVLNTDHVFWITWNVYSSNTLSMRLVSRIVWLAVWYAKSIHSNEPKQSPNVNTCGNLRTKKMPALFGKWYHVQWSDLFKKKAISRNCLMYFTKHTSKFDIHGHLITRISLRGWGCITI